MKRQFNESIYSSISLTRLAIFAIHEITNNGEECAYERVVKECFTLFPKRFSFQRYSEWPDGSRIKIEILRCRDNGYVTGNEKNGFQITLLGKRVAQEVLKELQGGKVKKHRIGQTRDRGDTIIKYLKENEPFRRFQQNRQDFNISEGEFRRLFVATFETPPRVLKQNLNYCLDVCKQYGENELFEFLKECKRQKPLLFKAYIKRRKK
jgi:AraC-like DNA-binding protein